MFTLFWQTFKKMANLSFVGDENLSQQLVEVRCLKVWGTDSSSHFINDFHCEGFRIRI